VAVLLVVVAVVAVVVVVVTRIPPEPVPSTCSVSSGSGSGSLSITPEQAQNAAIISAVALRKSLPDHAVTVALAAALQESKLLNLPYGDQDSVGLFQQRPSQGWGTATQILDPNYATSAFYDHLVSIDGWQAMPVTEAAQLVQRSAAPSAYAFWEAKARALARALTGEIPAGLTCHLAGYGGPVPPSGELAAAAAQEMGSNVVGVPVSTKIGWRVATWAVAHAYNYHLGSVAFAGWRWTSGSGAWQQGAGSVRNTSSVVTTVGVN
jgi:hypothetical protein